MNILYISRMMSQKAFTLFLKTVSTKPSQSMKFHRLMVEGFANNDNVKVKAISDYPISHKVSKKIFLKGYNEIENKVNYQYLTTINIRLIRNIISFVNCFFKTFIYLKKDKNSLLITDILCHSISAGSILASKILRRKCIAIVTDLPDMIFKDKFTKRFNNKVALKYDAYIFLTEFMNEYLNKKNKPYIIIEGVADKHMEKIENLIENKHKTKVVIYAGSLKKIYGIDTLIYAFIKADVFNAELHIYGNGDYAEEIQKLCLDYTNIKYFGVKENLYIVQEQVKATLLVNPRPSNYEYTKYSFPSKNMEYMTSGTPVLTTKLPGMPKEYYNYVYLIEDESSEGIAKELREVLNKSKEELYQKGLSAKQFVLEYKNNVKQA